MHIFVNKIMRNHEQGISLIFNICNKQKIKRRYLLAINTLMLFATKKYTGLLRNLGLKTSVNSMNPG